MYNNATLNIDKCHGNGYVDSSSKDDALKLETAENSDVQLLHQKQTTRKITTVTQVVREFQHMPTEEYMIDCVTMPHNPKHPSSDARSMDYNAVNIREGAQLIYGNSSQNRVDNIPSGCFQEGVDLPPQCTGLDEFEYSTHYTSESPAPSVTRTVPQYSFSVPPPSCSVISSQGPIINQSQNLQVSILSDQSLSQRRFFQAAQFADISEYGMVSAGSNYAEDPIEAYGFATNGKFALSANNMIAGSCSSRPNLFGEEMNGSGSIVSSDTNARPFESQINLQNKMAHLALNSVSITHTDDIVDGSESDLCSNLRWRDPNLSEVISFLNSPNNSIKANAAAYLQHLCYMDDPNKQRTRSLGGIPPLVRLLAYDIPDIHKNACGALRNLSYGRQNDENKRAIKNSGGIAALVSLLCRTQDSEVKELVTGVLWNMSSCEDIKHAIIDEGLNVLVNNIIKPHSGWDPVCPGDTCYSTVFRNASGVLRNISSAGEIARSRMRNSESLVECLLYVVQKAIEKNNIGNKTVENCVCILRNLSYRCQEIEDPNYDKHPLLVSRINSSSRGENLGCFGTNKRKKAAAHNEHMDKLLATNNQKKLSCGTEISKGCERLWQPEAIQYYLALLQTCSNPETLEAAAGAIQNLSACYWQPSIDIRATVRKEKGLPVLVELLRMEVDRVVCAVATALRNLAIDQRNKELIGKYAMRDLVQKLPSGNSQHDQNTSDDTISAVLATINEVIKKNPEFSRSLLDAGGVERLMNITRCRQKYSSCALKFASQVLFTMWQHNELRDVYKKNGWKEQDFVSKTLAAQNSSPHSPSNINNTLNRPMASQGRTRYEDRTIQRSSINRFMGHHIANESCSVSQIADESSANGGRSGNYQQENQNIAISMFAPVDIGRTSN